MLRKMQMMVAWLTSFTEKFKSPLKTSWGCLCDIFELTVVKVKPLLYCDNGYSSSGAEKNQM